MSAPATLGRYRILGLVGRGGMGEVYVAQESGPSGRRVALKVMRSDVELSPERVRRFERERALLARAAHPHVVPCLGPLETDGSHVFFPMELVLGKSLADLLSEHGPFPLDEAARILAEVASALGAAHAAGIVHRDVKPSNILLDRERRARLTDFGLARTEGESRLTASGHTLGTPAYLSPEQARGEEAGPDADLYALGAVAYELVTGTPPFRAESPVALLRLHLDERPRPPREIRPTIPAPFDALILRLLAKDPAARGTAALVQRELEALARSSPGAERAFLGRVETAIVRDTRSIAQLVPSRSRLWFRAAVVAAVLALCGTGVVLVRPGRASRTVKLHFRDGRAPVEGNRVWFEGSSVNVETRDGTIQKFERQDVKTLDYEDR